MKARAVLLVAAAAALRAQSLEIYSEFQRMDPFGKVAAPDRGGQPREILSPAVARNAWASFHLVAGLRPEEPAFLYLQQNPEVLKYELYRELYVKTEAGWIPDGLERVTAPYTILPPEMPGQTTAGFWLDLWVPAEAPARRMRFEALLKSGDLWIMAPMEIRIMEATAPQPPPMRGGFPPASARADAAVLGPLCGQAQSGAAPALSIRRMIRRNGLQDVALAGSRISELREKWCRPQTNPEWYLQVRDELLRSPPRR